MQVMDYQEGYADGLAGAGMQERAGYLEDAFYRGGFEDGSLDRRDMLANQPPFTYGVQPAQREPLLYDRSDN